MELMSRICLHIFVAITTIGFLSGCHNPFGQNSRVDSSYTPGYTAPAPSGPTSATVTATTDAGSTCAPANQSVNLGGFATFTVTASAGYVLNSSVGGTCPAGAWSGSSYTTGAIASNCSVNFTSTATTPTVTNGLIETTSVTYSSGNANVSLSWQAPTDSGTPSADQKYKICYSSTDPSYNSFSTSVEVSAGTCTTETGSTTASLTIAAGHAYYLNIIVTNPAGSSALYSAKAEFLDPSEVAYFPLEGNGNDVTGSNNFTAASYNGTTATAGAYGTDRFGNSSAAYNFGSNNTGACLMTGTNISSSVTGTSARSVAFWMSPVDAGTTFDPFSFGESQAARGEHFGLRYDTGQTLYGIWGYGDDYYSTAGLTTGWQFWVVTYSGGTGSPIGAIYRNGTQALLNTSFSPDYNTAGTPFFLGCDIDGSLGTSGSLGHWFSGSISAVRIFSRVLCDGTGTNGCASSTDEIANMYNSSRP